MSHIYKRLVEHIDRQIMAGLLGGRTNNVPPPAPEPLTLRTLQDMRAKLPKRETWLSTRKCPSGSALVVEAGQERFTVAHPSFWDRVRYELRREREAKPVQEQPALLAFNWEPIEIDAWEGDDVKQAKWRAAHWDRLLEAVEVAMVPLPDWLKAPPKFRDDRK